MRIPKSIIDEFSAGTVKMDEMVLEPHNNYTNILVLRELKSHAVFTTNGLDADTATLGIEKDGEYTEYTSGLMFMRKQTGSDRRFAKSLQRDLLGTKCTMKVNQMCQDCVECILYGSAASETEGQEISITSRVMYDTAYSVRDASAVIDEKFQLSPGDEYAKGPTTTPREPDFFEPGTLFPSVITLRDTTPEEVAFVLAITFKNKRYGAVTSRLGRVKNHLLGVFVGSEEGPANLELSQGIVKRFANEDNKKVENVILSDTLPIESAKEYTKHEFDELTEPLGLNQVDSKSLKELINIATSDDFREILKEQEEASRNLIKRAG